MAVFKEFFGDVLLTKDEEIDSEVRLSEADVIGIFFAGCWCGPCRGLTPLITDAYKSIRSAGKRFEIVFVSVDQDQEAFDTYFAEMPWPAVPYSKVMEGNMSKLLLKKFKVREIPAIVLLDKNASIITADGRTTIERDAKGENFPWIPCPIGDVLGSKFLAHSEDDGEDLVEVESSTFAEKHVALYFSAHWCPPCKSFTPKLVETYKALEVLHKEDRKGLEVIFVSSDNSEPEFVQYFAEMPWLALPYRNPQARQALKERFGVTRIPSLVILDPDLNVVNQRARSAVQKDVVAGAHTGAKFPWKPDLVPALEDAIGFIKSTPTFVVLAEGCDPDSVNLINQALIAAAEGFASSINVKNYSSAEIRYTFTDGKSRLGSKLARRLRKLIQLGEPTSMPDVALLDLSDSVYYVKKNWKPTSEAIQKLLEDFLEKRLKLEIVHSYLEDG